MKVSGVTHRTIVEEHADEVVKDHKNKVESRPFKENINLNVREHPLKLIYFEIRQLA